jgi:sugar O-acyltransferase (sialic acid O-acetyltransferase NeuD family)
VKYDLIIAGAGHLGRELAGWSKAEDQSMHVAFVDDTMPNTPSIDGVPVLGAISSNLIGDDDPVMIAIAEPHGRVQVYDRLGWKRLPAWIHRTTVLSNGVSPSSGCILMPMSLMSVGSKIGRGCIVNVMSSVGHDVTLGDFCTLSSHVDLCGGVHVGNRVFFGSGARVLPGLTIGDDAVIGAGSVVMRNVPASESWFGIPAKRIL